MGNLGTIATVSDVVSEFLGSGSGPYTLLNAAGITSGQIYDKITEANATLQGWTSVGVSGVTDALQKEQIKRFETVYATARLAADLIGINVTDGFNVSLAGLAIQRYNAQHQTYLEFIKQHLSIAQYYIKMLHPWFFVFNSDFPQGYSEMGTPVTYWSTSEISDL